MGPIRNPKSPFYSILLVVALVGLAAATIVAFTHGKAAWNGFIVGGFLLAFLAFYWWEDTIPSAVLAIAAWATAFNAAGWTWNWYEPVWGYDELGHAIGTLAAVLVLAWYVYAPWVPLWPNHNFSVSIAVLCLGITVSTAWEVAEWLGYYFSTGNPGRVFHDIFSDLGCDTLGALAAIPIAYWAYADRFEA